MTISPAFVSAIRGNRLARHFLFRMDHDDGPILAWDGVRSLDFNGETYLGVAGRAQIGGVSDSADFQNHELTCKLNAVPLSVLTDTGNRIGGKSVRVTAVWIDAHGLIVDSAIIFDGQASHLRTVRNGRTVDLTVHAKAPVSNWSNAPGAFYTDRAQRRQYPDDTGFSRVAGLQNASISGWSPNPETVAARIEWDDTYKLPRHTDTGEPFLLSNGRQTRRISNSLREQGTNDILVEATSGAFALFNSDNALELSSGLVRPNIDGEAQSPGGERIIVNGAASKYLQTPALIASDGVAGAINVPSTTRTFLDDASGRLIVCNNFGQVGASAGVILSFPGVANGSFVDAVTGDSVVAITGGVLGTPAGAIVVSDTGVILSALGNRLRYIDGDPTTSFLRLWEPPA